MKAAIFAFLFCILIIGFANKAEAEILPLTECMSLTNESTTYVLQNDLTIVDTNSSSSCLFIIAHNVTVDGGFHTLLSDGSFSAIKVGVLIHDMNIDGINYTTIKNFNITGACVGIDAQQFNNITIESVNITDDNCDSMTFSGNNITISGSYFKTLAGDPIQFGISDIPSFGIAYNNYFADYEYPVFIGGSIIFFNNSEIGNFWGNSTGNRYSQTCVDADVDGICDVPYNVTTDTGCTAGVDCGDNVDYLPLAQWPYQPEEPEGGEPLVLGYLLNGTNFTTIHTGDSLSFWFWTNATTNQNLSFLKIEHTLTADGEPVNITVALSGTQDNSTVTLTANIFGMTSFWVKPWFNDTNSSFTYEKANYIINTTTGTTAASTIEVTGMLSFIPIIFGIILAICAVSLSEEHPVLKKVLIMAAVTTLAQALWLAGLAVHYANPEWTEFGDAIGTLVWFGGVMSIVVLVYILITTFVDVLAIISKRRAEKEDKY